MKDTNFNDLPDQFKLFLQDSENKKEKAVALKKAYIEGRISDLQYHTLKSIMVTRFIRDVPFKTGALPATVTSGEIPSMDWKVTEITALPNPFLATNQDYILVVNNPAVFTGGTGTITVDLTGLTPREGQTMIVIDDTGLIGFRNPANLAPFQINVQLGVAHAPFDTSPVYQMLVSNTNGQIFQYTNGAWSVFNPTDKPIFRLDIDTMDRLAIFDQGNFYQIDRDITLNLLGTFLLPKQFIVEGNRSFNITSSLTNSTSNSDIGGGFIFDPAAGGNTMIEMVGGNNNGSLRNLYLQNASSLPGNARLFSQAAPTPQGTFTFENLSLVQWPDHGELHRAKKVDINNIDVAGATNLGMKFRSCQHTDVRHVTLEYSTIPDSGFFDIENDNNITDQVANFNQISLTSTGASDTKKILEVVGGGASAFDGRMTVSQCTNGGNDIFARTADRIGETDVRINVEQSNPNNSHPLKVLDIFSPQGTANQVPVALNTIQTVIFDTVATSTNLYMNYDQVTNEFIAQKEEIYGYMFSFSVRRTDLIANETLSIQVQIDTGGGYISTGIPDITTLTNAIQGDTKTISVTAQRLKVGDKIRVIIATTFGALPLDIGLIEVVSTPPIPSEINYLPAATAVWSIEA